MSPLQLDILRHIEFECKFIIGALDGKSKEEVINDPILFRAFCRSLEIIGEATKKLPREIRPLYPSVKWNEMAGMRDIIIHKYDGIDTELVWNAISVNVPELARELTLVIETEKNKK